MAEHSLTVVSPVAGTLIRIEVETGQRVAAGDALAFIESMKMEIPVDAVCGGTIVRIDTEEAQQVAEAQGLFVLQPD